MEYVKRIAAKEARDRMTAIAELLREMGAEFQVQHFEDAENIVLSFPSGEKRMVIGAHWDADEGSSGANDNASGCAVLLRVIKELLGKKNFEKSVDFVFFGEEEKGGIGATRYIESVGSENITAMVNLDMCGFGDRILLNDKGNLGDPLFSGLTEKTLLERHGVQLPGFLPEGDDYIFELNRIPSISVCTADGEAKAFFTRLAQKAAANQPIDEADQELFTNLDVVKTMHGGELDSVSSIDGKAIEMTTAYLLEGLLGK